MFEFLAGFGHIQWDEGHGVAGKWFRFWTNAAVFRKALLKPRLSVGATGYLLDRIGYSRAPGMGNDV